MISWQWWVLNMLIVIALLFVDVALLKQNKLIGVNSHFLNCQRFRFQNKYTDKNFQLVEDTAYLVWVPNKLCKNVWKLKMP